LEGSERRGAKSQATPREREGVTNDPAEAHQSTAQSFLRFIYLEDYDVVNDFREAGFEDGGFVTLTWPAGP